MKLPIHHYYPHASRMILGTMNLGGGWNSNSVTNKDINQAYDLVTKALELGTNVIDLADIYTYGKAETTIGELLKKERALRHHVILQSKVGIRIPPSVDVCHYDLSGQWITQAVNESIKRLQDNTLDILFLHRPDPLMQLHDTANALLKLHEQGKFEYLAVSNMHAGQVAYLQSALNVPIIANQLEMSLASYDFVEDAITVNMPINANSGFPRGTMEYCQQAGIQLQAWGAMAQGRFAGNCVANDKNIETSSALVAKLAQEYNVDTSAIVLAWLMRHPANIQPVLGTTNVKRLANAHEALNIQLSQQQWYHLLEAIRGQSVP